MDIRNDRRAFPSKRFPPIWADAEWIYDHLAEGGEHFLLPYNLHSPHPQKVYFSSVTPHLRHILLKANRLGVTDG